MTEVHTKVHTCPLDEPNNVSQKFTKTLVLWVNQQLFCHDKRRRLVRIQSGVPKCVDERCNEENAAQKCGVFAYNAPLLE